MEVPNLYRQSIFCLHGPTGTLTADAGSSDTTFSVQAAVLSDVTIDVGSTVRLEAGADVSDTMKIIAVDHNANTFTTSSGPGRAFLASAPTTVARLPHWADVWTGSPDDLTECPEDPAHPVQAGSAKLRGISGAGSWVVTDTRPTGTLGGSYPAKKVWTQRVLNSISGNSGQAVQLGAPPASDNQLLIADGAYMVSASAPAIRLGNHKIRLRNVTDGLDSIVGASERSDPTVYRFRSKDQDSDDSDGDGDGSAIPTGSRAVLEGVLNVTAGPKVFELQHYGTSRRRETYGLGDSVGAPGVPEVYTILTISRLVV